MGAGRMTSVGGLTVETFESTSQAVEQVIALALEGNPANNHIHFVNAYTVALADRDANVRAVFNEGSLNFPDGKPVAFLARWQRKHHQRRSQTCQVRGPSFFNEMLKIGRAKEVRHYLLGSTPDVLLALRERAENLYPGVRIVGQYCPPFRPLTAEELVTQDEAILATKAQIVWLGLGTPKQDFETRRLAAHPGVLPIAIGAAFDFLAGSQPEAPGWIRHLGIEWLFRLVSEPRRLWRRYTVGNLHFLRAITRYSGSR